MRQPTCGGCNSDFLDWGMERQEAARLDYPEVALVTYRVCAWCGLVMKTPIPSDEDLQRIYSGGWQTSLPRPAICWESAARWIKKHTILLPGWTAHDIGSKGAQLGDALEVKLAWDCYDAHPVGEDIKTGWIGSGQNLPEPVDFVSATHVLEHSASPLLFLVDILAILKPDGIAYVEVPSLEGHANDAGVCDDLAPDHIWHFTFNSLVSTIQNAGGSVIACATDLIPGWPVLRALFTRQNAGARRAAVNMERSSVAIRREYDHAGLQLFFAKHKFGAKVGLYAASHGYQKLIEYCPIASEFPVFDLYRTGKTFGGREIIHPDRMAEIGIECVYVTSRFWSSYYEIKRSLSQTHPLLEVHTPYLGL